MMADYFSDGERESTYYKARRGKIHKFRSSTGKFLCGRRLTWNYNPLYSPPEMTKLNSHHFCKRCFKKEKETEKVLTSFIPDELFEI